MNDKSGPITRRRAVALIAAVAVAAPLAAALPQAARADSPAVIDIKVQEAIARLHKGVQGSQELMSRAKGVLIMPGITKAGLLVGGAYGEGALLMNGGTSGYYSVAAASFGLQAGAQKFDQALFFMTTDALEKFRRSEGWEMGADAEVTIPKDGLSAGLSTTTTQNPVISVTFGQTGLMAGVSLEGAKYSRLH